MPVSSELARLLKSAESEADLYAVINDAVREELDGQEPIRKILYTKAEAAFVMGISKRTLENLIRDGSIPKVKLGSLARVRHEDLVAFATRHLEHTQRTSEE